jgi:hypothetical protein
MGSLARLCPCKGGGVKETRTELWPEKEPQNWDLGWHGSKGSPDRRNLFSLPGHQKDILREHVQAPSSLVLHPGRKADNGGVINAERSAQLGSVEHNHRPGDAQPKRKGWRFKTRGAEHLRQNSECGCENFSVSLLTFNWNLVFPSMTNLGTLCNKNGLFVTCHR